MPPFTAFVSGCLVIAILVAAAGCVSNLTPVDRVDLAANTLDSAVKVLTALKAEKVIAPSDAANISAALHAADAALHLYQLHASEPVADQYAAQFWAAFAQVEPWVVRLTQKK